MRLNAFMISMEQANFARVGCERKEVKFIVFSILSSSIIESFSQVQALEGVLPISVLIIPNRRQGQLIVYSFVFDLTG